VAGCPFTSDKEKRIAICAVKMLMNCCKKKGGQLKICETEGCDRAIKDNFTFCEVHPYNLPNGCWFLIGLMIIGLTCSIMAAMYAFIKWCVV
jgi:hypothetical protein